MTAQKPRSLNMLIMIFAVLMPPTAMASETPPSGSSVIAENSRPAKVSKKKITDRSHPDYKHCRRESVIGSLARVRTVCMTKREWEQHVRAGNAGARAILDDINKGG